VYRIRLHGRGGQGIRTASRILGNALFASGFTVQDAPLYGAERRGAPVFAWVRAARAPIHERGVILDPDLVVVADETLVPVAAAGVLVGVTARTVCLLRSAAPPATWRERLKVGGPVVTLPLGAEEVGTLPLVGATCAGGAARLLGVLSREALARAIEDEIGPLGRAVVAESQRRALEAYDRLAPQAGAVREGETIPAGLPERPAWVDVPAEAVRLAAPDVHAAATSVQVRTGLWRTMRPVIDHDLCRRCAWICTTFCPDSAIAVGPEGAPVIDYDHCKGCLVCVAVCPPHAIRAVPEREAAAETPAETP
jgi:pyruvate ferredoxin oxidoreductase gamma subunit